MFWHEIQIIVLDAAAALIQFAVNWLLQSALLIAAGLAVGQLVAGRGSAAQSAVYRTTLAAVLVCPLVSWLLAATGANGWSLTMPRPWAPEAIAPSIVDASRGGPVPALAEPSLAASQAKAAEPWPVSRGGSTVAADSAAAGIGDSGGVPPIDDLRSAMASIDSAARKASFSVRAFGWLALTLGALWFFVSAVLVGRLGLAWWKLGRLRRSAVLACDASRQLCRQIAAELGVVAAPVLRSPFLPSPCLAGWFRPVVLLPEADLGLSLRDVLTHELAHLKRRDCHWTILRHVSLSILFFQPLLWRLSRRLETTAEEVCDDFVVELGGDRIQYAHRLVDIAELAATPLAVAGVGIVSLRSMLAHRVGRIMDTSRPLSTRIGSLFLALALIGGLLGTVAVALVGIGPRQSAAEPAKMPPAAKDDSRAATETKTAATGDEAAPAPIEAQTDTLQKTVRVVNELGEPVAGATVAPRAIRSVQGAHGVWMPGGFGDSTPPVLTTDADGKATIPFPRFARAAERIPPRELTCRVDHPDYAETTQNDVSVTPEELDKVATVVLQKGARVEVTPLQGGQPLPADWVRAQWSGPATRGAKVNADGRLELPRLVAGTQLLRLAYVPEQGPLLISDVETLKLTNGERREVKIEVKPAARVAGRLDPAVPRPVKNGRVVASIIEKREGDWAGLHWAATATTDVDGTFVFEDLPRGDLQVIALCDGFIAKAGIPPAFAGESADPTSPQVFHLSEAENEIVVKMVPSASCRVRVLDPDGNPLAGAMCTVWPGVHWWDGGSQVYCAPGWSTAEALRNPKPGPGLIESRKGYEKLFTTTTDAEGIAIIKDLPAAQERLTVQHDDVELPLSNAKAKERFRPVELKAGQQTEVTVQLQKKGTEFIGSRSPGANEKSPEELAKMKEQEAAAAKNVALAKKFDTADAAYTALAGQFDAARAAFVEARQQAGTDKKRAEARQSRPEPLEYMPAFFLIAEQYPDDPAAVLALVWIARHRVFGEEAAKALKILSSKYSRSKGIAAYVATPFLYGEPFEPYEEFLRTVLKENPDRNVQGAATAILASYLKMAVNTSRSRLVEIALGRWNRRAESLAALNHLKERGLDNVAAESETLFERVIQDYPDVQLERFQPHDAGTFAKGQLFELKNLSIGKPALELEGTDISGAKLKLSDYRGKVVVLEFGSHRTCGICRALYPDLRSLVEQFEGQPFALIGINAYDDLNELKELTSKGETTWRVVWDGDEAEGPICSQWLITGMPTVYVLDQAGVIR
ncbi:MAG TPA: M56 family metallopeptidase, partial [Pirellulales bacterium]|nr:M56 family metallopeptidase [Pirellulales bacterium]